MLLFLISHRMSTFELWLDKNPIPNLDMTLKSSEHIFLIRQKVEHPEQCCYSKELVRHKKTYFAFLSFKILMFSYCPSKF